MSGGRDMTWKATVVTETDPSEVWQGCRVSECGRKNTGMQGVTADMLLCEERLSRKNKARRERQKS